MSSVVNIGELKKIAEHNPREYIKRFYDMDATAFKSLTEEDLRELIRLLIDCYKQIDGASQDSIYWENIERHFREFFDEPELEMLIDSFDVEHESVSSERDLILDLDDLNSEDSTLAQ